MSLSSRLFRGQTKIQAKFIHKSSLPKIEFVQNSKGKFLTPSPVKIAFKNVRKLGRNHQLASNFTQRQTHMENDQKNIVKDHYQQSNKLHRALSKDSSKTAEKQLITACTINIEQDINSKDNNIKQTEHKGMDMWALNKNLKQVLLEQNQKFSQTRKVAFFKPTNKKYPNEISSTVSKNRTQQIKSMYKVYYGGSKIIGDPEKQKSQTERKPKKMSEVMLKRKFSQHEARQQHSMFSNKNKLSSGCLENTIYGTLPIRKHRSDFNPASFLKDKKTCSEHKIESPHPQVNPYLRTFVNGSHLKRQSSNKKIEILEMNNFTSKASNENELKNQINSQKKSKNFRRNRFEKILSQQKQIQQNEKSPTIKHNHPITNEHKKLISTNTKQQDLLFTFQFIISPQKQSQDNNYQKQLEEKRSQYEYSRSIQKVSKSLLKSIDDYMDNYQTFSTIQPSKIHYFVDSLNYPLENVGDSEFKSTYIVGDDEFGRFGDGFSFQETKKATAITNEKLKIKSKKQKVSKS